MEHATDNVPKAARHDRAGEIVAGLAGRRFDAAHDVVVIDSGRAVGLVPLEALLAAAPGTPAEELMQAAPPAVSADTDQEIAAHAMARVDARSLVVAGADGSFRGLIPAERMVEVLVAEHAEDMAQLGGYLAGSSQARGAAEEPISRRLWHRLPWLMVGVLGAMVTAVIMGAFDAELERNVIVAFFVPAIVYMSGAVGAQTVTVLIRALAAGVTTRSILVRELITGVIMGAAIGAAFFPFVAIGWGEQDVAAAVSFALFASCALSTVVALALPAALQRLGKDPAFGSGPLGTVIQDLLAILVYLGVVSVVV